MRLVRLQFLVVGVLDVDGPAPQLRYARGEVVDHRRGRGLVTHLEEGLVLSLEHEDVRHAAERDAQVDDLGLRDVIRNVADVDDARRLADRLFQFRLEHKQRNVLSITEIIGGVEFYYC